MENNFKKIEFYTHDNKKEPFIEWFKTIKDKNTQARIIKRLVRLDYDNYGDYKDVGNNVYELRLDFGPGYRIYFGELQDTRIILILSGGDKSSQSKDIGKAKEYWENYIRRLQNESK